MNAGPGRTRCRWNTRRRSSDTAQICGRSSTRLWAAPALAGSDWRDQRQSCPISLARRSVRAVSIGRSVRRRPKTPRIRRTAGARRIALLTAHRRFARRCSVSSRASWHPKRVRVKDLPAERIRHRSPARGLPRLDCIRSVTVRLQLLPDASRFDDAGPSGGHPGSPLALPGDARRSARVRDAGLQASARTSNCNFARVFLEG